MADLIRSGMTWLADQLQTQVSQQVTYRRAALSVLVQATLGSQLLKTTDGRGNTKTERTDRDFLIRAADLILGAVVATPERGDRVEVTFGTVVQRFEVMAPGTEAPWRYEDAHQQILRVHSKYLGNA